MFVAAILFFFPVHQIKSFSLLKAKQNKVPITQTKLTNMSIPLQIPLVQ